jgi:maltodextrin utilization protein YvdJ
MGNPVLQSESFERAAYSLSSYMEQFSRNSISHDVQQFAQAVEQFRLSVDKLTIVLGMQAENDQRKAVGLSMAYTEDAFVSVR